MIAIRAESPADTTEIRRLLTAVFPTATEARLVDALRDAGRLTLSLVAVEQGAVVGHVAFSPVTTAARDDGVGLAPVAVLPGYRRRGIAAELVRSGLASCKQRDHGFVVVLGDPAYYHRFGFEPAATWGLVDEFGGGEAFQALELRTGAMPKSAGVIRYAAEFATLASHDTDKLAPQPGSGVRDR